ncbi:hypothetical protein LWF15_03810 [Kineosporia rhizophila]|uniref:hypothetical protein n=1 Tax=Kineosporia rhizophila TaxID=84633 RepID=UPI001E2C844C|nr:hypothetical protein [Kineosporia rhizophila]MCE0534625.1 hypothetical protein [Kineosporia rhizophila]
MLVLVCAAVLLAGCTEPHTPLAAASPVASPGVSGVVGPTGGRVAVPGGPVVDVPAGAVSGAGTLVVREPNNGRLAPVSGSPFLGVGGAYEIALQGARLTGPVRLTFPVRMEPLPAAADADAAAVLGHYDTAERTWKIVPAQYDPDKKTITAEVYELAWWNAFVWDFSRLRDAVATTYASVLAEPGAQPTCEHESAARLTGVRVSAGPSERIRWCYGLADGAPVLKVVNVGGYPISIEHPRSWPVRRHEDSVRMPPELDALVKRPGKVLLAGGSTLELRPDGLTPGGTVTARTSGAGFLALALALGQDSFDQVSAGVPGARPAEAADVLRKVLEGDCLERYTRRMDRPVPDLADAEQRALEAHTVAFDCLRRAWPGSEAFIGVALAWLASGIGVLLDGVTGVADAAVFAEPETIQVRVDQ